jgi:lipid-A-disaccharide synthase
MKYYIISGEASGDLHASNLMAGIRVHDKAAIFRAWGGDLMQQQGATLVKHYRDLAFMGFVEVVANLKTIAANIRFCKHDIKAWKPDVVIFVDYPGFNLRILPYVKKLGIATFYYISPQIWAWKQNRIKLIKQYVDEMFVILPFEKQFYAQFGINVHYEGHPLLDAFEHIRQERPAGLPVDKKIIALLPGSRKQEIKKMLPEMLKAIENNDEYFPVIAAVSSVETEFYSSLIGKANVLLIVGNTYGVLKNSDAAIVTSGTATLEAALLNIPLLVCYKGSKISYWIARRLIHVNYISLVNLILNKPIVKELIQDEMNAIQIQLELQKLLSDTRQKESLMNSFQELKVLCGKPGSSFRTASTMVQLLKETYT